MSPGRLCADVYKEVNGWAQAEGPPEGFKGYGENRVKFFGHGVGLELDEMPVIADRIELELQAGMVVAVEGARDNCIGLPVDTIRKLLHNAGVV